MSRSKKEKFGTPFDRLVTLLEGAGFDVRVKSERRYAAPKRPGGGLKALPANANYRFALVTGKNVYGGFCEPNDGSSYSYIDGKIAADNNGCFDKWAKCPLCLSFPLDADEGATLLALLAHLGSEEGYALSNSYDYNEPGKNPYRYDGQPKS